jgi:hypothetical protein
LRSSGPYALLASLTTLAAGALLVLPTLAPLASAPPVAGPARPHLTSLDLPLSFEPNYGQVDPAVTYLARGDGYTLFLTADEAVLALTASAPAVLRWRLVAADPAAAAAGQDGLPGRVHYYLGNDPAAWRTDVPTYARVRYTDVYPGIDLVYHGTRRQLEYDFVVAPGATPDAIRLAFAGADGLEIDAAGDLLLHLPNGTLRQPRPTIYQEGAGARERVPGGYRLLSAPDGPDAVPLVAFAVGPYDPTRPLVIDPTFAFSTYLGGAGDDQGLGVAVDAAGNVYVAGSTTSVNFPVTAGSLQTSLAGARAGFVAKLAPAGNALLYATYLGGNNQTTANAIVIDGAGNAYLTGSTSATNFPVTSGVFQPGLGGGIDAFVAKLNSTGNSLLYAAYLGGSGQEQGFGLAIDAAGNAYVTGYTDSPNFPVTAGAYRTTPVGGVDSFVTKVNAAGTALVFSTYLGGSGDEGGAAMLQQPPAVFPGYNRLALDPSGNVYVTGRTNSGDFPTVNALQGVLRGGFDAYVSKLDASGATLLFSTYLGSTADDAGYGIAVDAAGNAYVTGAVGAPTFPVGGGVVQTVYGGGTADAFVAKVGPTGALFYSTFLGGAGADEGHAIAVDTAGAVYLTGQTTSSNFPVVSPVQVTLTGAADAFVTKLAPGATAFEFSTYLGGLQNDAGHAVAADLAGAVYVVGQTASAGSFPVSVGAYQTVYGGGVNDVIVAKMVTIGTPPPTPTLTPLASATPTPTTPPTATSTPTPTPFPTPINCVPRPSVLLNVTPTSGGRLAVTVAAQSNSAVVNNAILRLTFGGTPPQGSSNDVVEINGTSQSGSFVIVPSPPATALGFFVRQADPSQPTTVQLIVRDRCGDWPTFVGGGLSAFATATALGPQPAAPSRPPTPTPGARAAPS